MTGRGVAVAGAAECDLGVTGLDVLTLQTQAITRALADAGLGPGDVDGLATNGVGRFPTTQIAEHLGLDLAWTESSFAGGSVFEMYVARAAQAIEAGQCSVVVISYASNQRSARSRSLSATGTEGLPEAVFEAPYGPLYPASHYAMAAQRYLEVHGHDRSVLAEVAVAARAQALLNPAAYRYGAGPLSVGDVLAAAPVSDPLGVLDCCLVTDGGGAVVLTSLERARDLPHPPAVVLGCGEATTNVSMAGADDLLATGAIASGARAFRAAGLTPADVDVAQVYDSFTITVLLSLEGLGFAAPGAAPGLIGKLPLNTSGGGLSYCHPGQFGVLLLVEAVRQLRGGCGARQVAGVEVALAHGTGGILSTHATVLLGVDR